jgi:hypothetical protein
MAVRLGLGLVSGPHRIDGCRATVFGPLRDVTHCSVPVLRFRKPGQAIHEHRGQDSMSRWLTNKGILNVDFRSPCLLSSTVLEIKICLTRCSPLQSRKGSLQGKYSVSAICWTLKIFSHSAIRDSRAADCNHPARQGGKIVVYVHFVGHHPRLMVE